MLNVKQEDVVIKPYVSNRTNKIEWFCHYNDYKDKEKGYTFVLDIDADANPSDKNASGFSSFVFVMEVDKDKKNTFHIGHDRAYHKYNYPCKYCGKRNKSDCNYFNPEKVLEVLMENEEVKKLIEDETMHLENCEERWQRRMYSRSLMVEDE